MVADPVWRINRGPKEAGTNLVDPENPRSG